MRWPPVGGSGTLTAPIETLRHEIALACRVMAHRGLVEDILGHISVRLDDDHLLIRCRGPHEAGLAFTEPCDIHRVSLHDATVVDAGVDHAPPSELPIHTAIYRARPDVSCVVHAHPPDVVVASLAEIPLVPLVGAYNIPAAHLAERGIPVHPRSVLLRTDALAGEMVATLGEAPAVVLVGHGLVTTGSSVAEATLRALHVDTLARMAIGVVRAGGTVRAIPAADAAELPDLGSGFNEETLWRHHLRALDAAGLGIDQAKDGRR